MAVMGSGDIVVGKPLKSRQSSVKDPADNGPGQQPRPAKPRQQQMCGAMTQQATDNRTPSQPQEFVRLVGHRDSKVRPPGAR